MSALSCNGRRVLAALVVLPILVAACGAAGARESQSGKHGGGGSPTSTKPPAPTTTTQAAVKPVNGKVTVLEIGDSLGIDLGWGMQWALTNDSSVNLVEDAKGDSGLVNTTFYNWDAQLQAELQANHPQVVVVFLGGNDVQNFYQGNLYVSFGSAPWKQAYGARVGTLMSEATASGARVLWVGMPIMGPAHFSSEIAQVDAVFQSEAAKHPGVTYFSSWKLFSTPSGQFNAGTTDITGTASLLRDSDGIHLAVGGEDLLGHAVVTEMKAIYRLP